MSGSGLLDSWRVLAVWSAVAGASLVILEHDLRRNNPRLPRLMQWVWRLVVVYSGPLGLWTYGMAGRRQIPSDSLWRRGLRSVAHCYSGSRPRKCSAAPSSAA